VADGTRTHDHRDHNPGLYQLSYRHREPKKDSPYRARGGFARPRSLPLGLQFRSRAKSRPQADFVRMRPRSSADRAADFESACGGSTPPGAILRTSLHGDRFGN
jgi:hypothetical protein